MTHEPETVNRELANYLSSRTEAAALDLTNNLSLRVSTYGEYADGHRIPIGDREISDQELEGLIEAKIEWSGFERANIENVISAMTGNSALASLQGWKRRWLVGLLCETDNTWINTPEKCQKAWSQADESDVWQPGADLPYRYTEPVFQVVAEPGPDRVAAWKKQIGISPVEAMKGPKPDFLDLRRPGGFRIMPCSPSGAVVEWVGRFHSMKTGTALAEGLEAVRLGHRVVYVALEDPSGVDTLRLPAACAAHGLSPAELTRRFHTWGGPIDLLHQDEVEDFIAAVQGMRPTIFFFDVVTYAIGSRNISEPSVGIGLANALMRIASAFRATVIALTHPSDPTSGNTMQAFGSRLQGNLVYATVHIHYNDKTGVQRVHVAKMKNGEKHGFDVFMRNAPGADGVPVMVDVPADEWEALASRRKPADIEVEPEPTTVDQIEPTSTVAADLRSQVLGAIRALYEAGDHGPLSVTRIVKQISGGDEYTREGHRLGVAIRRRMKEDGSFADMVMPGTYTFKPIISAESMEPEGW
jgi:hypothetical protein